MPTPSSSTVMWHSAPASRATMLTMPMPGLRDNPCRTAFSTSGCRQRNGRVDRQHLGGDLQPHLEPVTEPGPLDGQVAVDRAQLLGEGGELAVRPERVAGELGELQDQLPGPLRVGADERARSRSARCR